MSPDIRHDEAGHRFVSVVDGREAYLSYRPAGARTLDFHHTFVPRELRGRGIARHLVDAAFRYAREGGYRVIPSCSYVLRVAHEVAEYGDLTT